MSAVVQFPSKSVVMALSQKSGPLVSSDVVLNGREAFRDLFLIAMASTLGAMASCWSEDVVINSSCVQC